MARYAITIFLSAFLLFLVQPLIGKYILPWFGGGPGVWTTCMVFFQGVLLAGYAYAHFIQRFSSRPQVVVHIALLLVSLAFLPIVPDLTWKPQAHHDPAWRILLLLTACIGVPYFALSATGPLLQAWFSRTHPGRSPYRLYALSNIGSLLALLGYPFVMEPAMARKTQTIVWSCGFAVFAVLCGYCAIRVSGVMREIIAKHGNAAESTPTALDRLLWILLPACASIMLLAVTSQLSEEIAPIPFLWILPLAVYLLSFIVTFEWPRLYYRPVFVGGSISSIGLVLMMVRQEHIGLTLQIVASMVVLFICCMICHGELYRLRPPARKLTAYYLGIAAGGALGGSFVSLAAPLLFDRYVEFYIGLFGSAALLLTCLRRDPNSIFFRGAHRLGWLALIALVLVGGLAIRMRISDVEENTLLRSRNFYGVLRIALRNKEIPEAQYLTLEHGRITHGSQFVHPTVRRWPTTYFGPHTGVGMVMRLFPKTTQRKVGIVGLGVGTLAAYGQSGDDYRFYEINPEVERLARSAFVYLQDSQANVQVVLGDARLSMEREESQEFDILVLDAFSGDAIPIHLLTKEAFDMYQRHLATDGVIMVHVSNRYVDLHPVVHRVGESLGFTTVFLTTPPDMSNLIVESHWLLMTRNQKILEIPEIAATAFRPIGTARVRLWTDDHASLLEVLRQHPP